MKPMLHDPQVEENALRARDAIVTGMREPRQIGRPQGGVSWIVVARANERVEDFFMDGPFGAGEGVEGEDPGAWICRSVRADGTLRMGVVDLDVDRFVSDVLNDQLRDAIMTSLR